MDDVQTAQVTSPSDSGGSESTELQDTPVSSQEPQTDQESESLKVEQSQQSTSSEPPSRRASDYYRERKQSRELKNEIAQLKEQISLLTANHKKQDSVGEFQLSESEKKKLEESLLLDPITFLYKRDADMKKQMREELLKELKEKELPSYLDSFEKEKDLKRKEQEALELIFPKSESNPKANLEERVNSDPQKAQMILDIMEEYGLNHFASVDPMSAAKKALELYDWKIQSAKKAPMSVKKSQMSSISNGSPIGGSEKADASSLVKQKEELMKQISENSSLMGDPEFMKKFDKISLALAKYKEN